MLKLAHGGSIALRALAEGGVERIVGVLFVVVVEQDCGGSGIGGGLGLLPEGAFPADDEHERTFGTVVVVAGLTAELSACQVAVVVIDRQHDGQVGQRFGRALGVLGGYDLEFLPVDADRDSGELLLIMLEGLTSDVEGACGLEGVLDVFHGLFVAGGAQRTESFVRMRGRDVGELLQMVLHGVTVDAHVGVFGRAGGACGQRRTHPAPESGRPRR